MKNSKNISFSAPGKVHLIGEHSVVYGKPAIISAINLRLTLTLVPASSRPRSLVRSPEGTIAIQKAIESAIKRTYKIKSIPAYSVEIEAKFPIGSGLGGSAAISATLTAALLRMLKIKATKEQVYDIALEGEKAIHGNPSGSDLSVIVHGGTLWFRKETNNLKIVSPLSLPAISFVLVDCGKPKESTGEMVAKVAKLSTKTKEMVFNGLEKLAKDFTGGGNTKQILKEAHSYLTKLGVVGKNAQEIIKRIEQLGGAAKITGAGGMKDGSGMILVFHQDISKLKSDGFQITPIKINQEGLRQEK